MVDEQGYRLNVAMLLQNEYGQLFWGRRSDAADAWQFPQGGIDLGETPVQAMYRELEEELGLKPRQVRLLDQHPEWIYYPLTPERASHLSMNEGVPVIGQKQIWFMLRLVCPDSAINLEKHVPPEFDRWRWEDWWVALEQTAPFKQPAYTQALEGLAHHLPKQPLQSC